MSWQPTITTSVAVELTLEAQNLTASQIEGFIQHSIDNHLIMELRGVSPLDGRATSLVVRATNLEVRA